MPTLVILVYKALYLQYYKFMLLCKLLWCYCVIAISKCYLYRMFIKWLKIIMACLSCILDIFNCMMNLHNCSQICVEVKGSFNCSCYAGYELQLDGISCEGNQTHIYLRMHMYVHTHVYACICSYIRTYMLTMKCKISTR